MITEITFPYHGCYTAKRTGYVWHYWVDAQGCVNAVERYYFEHYNGKDHSKWKNGNITKELLADIEKALGRKTDGWRWTTAEEEQSNGELLEQFPIDGSYRKMKKTSLIAKAFNRSRTIYEHTPTKTLYYNVGGTWFRTYPNYCYNTETGERGKWF